MRFDYEDEDEGPPPGPKKDEPKDGPEPKKGSAARFRARLERFKRDGRPLPRLRHQAFWLVHNCVAHPLLAVAPGVKAVEFHALTSAWLNHWPFPGVEGPAERFVEADLPKIPKRGAWFIHNTVGHIAIGLWPTERMFALHDRTAKAMDVPGWV